MYVSTTIFRYKFKCDNDYVILVIIIITHDMGMSCNHFLRRVQLWEWLCNPKSLLLKHMIWVCPVTIFQGKFRQVESAILIHRFTISSKNGSRNGLNQGACTGVLSEIRPTWVLCGKWLCCRIHFHATTHYWYPLFCWLLIIARSSTSLEC